MTNKLLSVLGFAIFAAGIAAATPDALAAASVMSVKMSGPNTITITYSEPVYTTISDYTNFTDGFAGFNLVSVGGSGTNTIVLVSSNTMSNTASGSLNIGPSVKDVNDNQYVTGATWTIVPLIVVPPAITSFTMSSNVTDGTFAGIGNIVTITFSLNKNVNVQSVSVAGRTVSFSGSGSGPYTVNYTVQSGDAQQSVPVSLVISDMYGTQGRFNLSFVGTNSGATTGNSLISSIVSNANTPGVLTPGGTIVFTLTPSVIQPNARISGYYNGTTLSWVTSNGGVNYTATYTVAVGHANQSYPVQITGVTLTDQYGNTSAPASGYDVQKTINAQTQGPVLSQVTAVPPSVTVSTPSYTFYSTERGTITYGGGCVSPTVAAMTGLNTVSFNPLANGTYSNCTIAVTNTYGVKGNTLTVPSFTVSGSPVPATNNPSVPANSSVAAQLEALKAQLALLQGKGQAPTSSYKFYNPLKAGSKGPEVSELQKRLTAEGVYTGPITTLYGPLTEAAVKKYQKLHGLNPLGNVGPGTRAVLNGE